MNAAIDRVGDDYPHGTVQGYDGGCRGGVCPAGEEHGLSCRRAKTLAAGDYRYARLVRAGKDPWEIALLLGLNPEVHAAPKSTPRVVVDDDKLADLLENEDVSEVEEETMVSTKPTPNDVAKITKSKAAKSKAGKPAKSAGPSQSEVRAWARANGIEVNPRGSVRADVVAAYEAAQAGTLTVGESVPVEAATGVLPASEVGLPADGMAGINEDAQITFDVSIKVADEEAAIARIRDQIPRYAPMSDRLASASLPAPSKLEELSQAVTRVEAALEFALRQWAQIADQRDRLAAEVRSLNAQIEVAVMDGLAADYWRDQFVQVRKALVEAEAELARVRSLPWWRRSAA